MNILVPHNPPSNKNQYYLHSQTLAPLPSLISSLDRGTSTCTVASGSEGTGSTLGTAMPYVGLHPAAPRSQPCFELHLITWPVYLGRLTCPAARRPSGKKNGTSDRPLVHIQPITPWLLHSECSEESNLRKEQGYAQKTKTRIFIFHCQLQGKTIFSTVCMRFFFFTCMVIT